jgi:hypothetical protein
MTFITPEQARGYLERWELVRQAEAAEILRTPMETKLRQLAALMQTRGAFGADPHREAKTREVRERWARIRQAMGA